MASEQRSREKVQDIVKHTQDILVAALCDLYEKTEMQQRLDEAHAVGFREGAKLTLAWCAKLCQDTAEANVHEAGKTHPVDTETRHEYLARAAVLREITNVIRQQEGQVA